MLDQRPHRGRRFIRQSGPMPARHAEDLRFIRETMERSAAFTAVSGWGHVVLGFSALAATWLAARQISPFAWLRVWLGEAVLAIPITLFPILWKPNPPGLPPSPRPDL